VYVCVWVGGVGGDFAPIKYAIWREKVGAGILGTGSNPSPLPLLEV